MSNIIPRECVLSKIDSLKCDMYNAAQPYNTPTPRISLFPLYLIGPHINISIQMINPLFLIILLRKLIVQNNIFPAALYCMSNMEILEGQTNSSNINSSHQAGMNYQIFCVRFSLHELIVDR